MTTTQQQQLQRQSALNDNQNGVEPFSVSSLQTPATSSQLVFTVLGQFITYLNREMSLAKSVHTWSTIDC